MKAVIETATGKALYLFADTDDVQITDAGMTGPIRAMDLRPSTHSIATATQPSFFVGGGVMQWSGGWVILDQEAYDAAYAAAQPPTPNGLPDISDRQFFQALAVRGDITEAEALDAVGPGIIPPAMDALIDKLPQEQRFAARMLIRGATRYERQHPIADLIRGLYGWSNEDADEFWRFAATL